MKLIAMLIALAIRPYLSSLERYRDPQPLMAYFGWTCKRSAFSFLTCQIRFTLALIPLLGVAYLVQYLVSDLAFGLGGLLLSIVVLIYTLGTQSFINHLDPFIKAWEAGDYEQAKYQALGFATPEFPIEETDDLPWQVTRHILVNANEKIFSILFWFVLLGPIGALGWHILLVLRDYAFKCEEETDIFKRTTHMTLHVVGWIPARLGAISYAAVGSFTDSIDKWFKCGKTWSDSNAGLLFSAGLGAMQIDNDEASAASHTIDEVRASKQLVTRATILWIAVIAVATTIGWIS